MVPVAIRHPRPPCPALGLILVPIALACLGADDPTAAPGQVRAMPMASGVEAQPLLAQLRRVRDAMTSIGNPLPIDVAERLDAIGRMTDAEAICAEVQRALDGLCLVAIEVDRDGKLAVVRGGADPGLVEQGWRSFLIKVVNRVGATGRLRVRSPNAGPVPNAPRDEVATRWLGLDLHDGQPLHADLGGLGLEYRILQVFSRDPGEKSALLEFCAAPGAGRPNSAIRQWRFDGGPDGWKAENQVRLSTSEGALRVEGTGIDPFLTAAVSARPGAMVLRFWAKSDRAATGQLFWWTAERPGPDPGHMANFDIEADRERLYEVPFVADGQLAGLRLDPASRPGHLRIDWMELAYADPPGEAWAGVPLGFRTAQATPIVFRVRDGLDAHALAAFEVRDALGRVYPEQSKRLAPDFFFQPQVYRGTGESVRVPPGRYTIRCRRGPESIPETRTVDVGTEPVTLDYPVRRWIDAASLGWWSGDHHIHAAGCRHYDNPTQGVTPDDMFRHTRGEDLKIGISLNWGPCFDFQKQFFGGRDADRSEPPYLLRQDVEISGFGSDRSGHLCLLNLASQIPAGGDSKDHWPTLGLSALRWAKAQGATCGTAHSAIGLERTVDRVPGTEGQDGPDGLPNYLIPAFDGIGANEFIVQVTHEVPGRDGDLVPAIDFLATMNSDRTAEWNLWYHVLNCGYRTRVGGETDFPCMTAERVGLGRSYVKLDGRPGFERWVDGLRAGRSYVSDGTVHLLDLRASSADAGQSVELGVDGSELGLDRGGEVEVRVRVAALKADGTDVPIELVVNGLPVGRESVRADGTPRDLTFRTRLERSGWLAVRARPDAHTNPIFVVIDGAPIRASRRSAEWCLRGVDQCWGQKQPSYRADEQADARRAYDHARDAYRRIMRDCPPGS